MEKTVKIAIVGAGMGGMCAAVQLEKQLPNVEYTIFDENADFGGVWHCNTYPGCACDIQSCTYSFSFEQNPNWTTYYASQTEIQAYLRGIANKYGLYKKTRFSTPVTSLNWDESRCQWKLGAYDNINQTEEEFYFDYVIRAIGFLRLPKIPPEFENFKGPTFHTARWDSTVDLKGKRVAVIGSGASAIQLIPQIVPIVKELHSYQRRPTWVLPKPSFDIAPFWRKLFTYLPIFMWMFRSATFLLHEAFTSAFHVNSFLNSLGERISRLYMRRSIPNNPELVKKFTPDTKFGCLQVCIGANYYSSFNLPHVHLHREPIKSVDGQKITTADGNSKEIDVLILATGFRTTDLWKPMKFMVIDEKGREVDLWDKWMTEDGPRSYYGVMSHILPNSFCVYGPYTGAFHNSNIFVIECQVNLIVKILRETLKRGSKTVRVTKAAQDSCMAQIFEDVKTAVWEVTGCGSYYTYEDGTGKHNALWPNSLTSYWRKTRSMDWKNLEWTFDTPSTTVKVI